MFLAVSGPNLTTGSGWRQCSPALFCAWAPPTLLPSRLPFHSSLCRARHGQLDKHNWIHPARVRQRLLALAIKPLALCRRDTESRSAGCRRDAVRGPATDWSPPTRRSASASASACQAPCPIVGPKRSPFKMFPGLYPRADSRACPKKQERLLLAKAASHGRSALDYTKV